MAPAAFAAPSALTSDSIVGFVDGVFRDRGWGRRDGVEVILTNCSIIFAIYSTSKVTELTKQAYQEARKSGKGWFDASLDSMDWQQLLRQRLNQMPVVDILRDNPDNFALERNQIRVVKLKRGRTTGHVHSTGFTRGGFTHADGHLILEAVTGRYEFGVVGSYHEKARQALAGAGIRVET